MSIFNMDYVRAFYQICLSIDVLLYKLIGSAFQIFNILSEARLFSSETIGRFTSRVYLIVSVVMLFILAYSFLTVIINPDNMTKGNSSPGKIVKNILVALVVLVFTPTAFNYAYGFQTSLIKNNVVGKIVIGAEKSDDIYAMSGEFATTVFTGSYYLAEVHSEEAELYYDTAVMSSKLENNIGAFVDTIPYVQTGDIEYNYVISTIVGAFVLYILVAFVFDLGLRAVKLAFLELFAPVPALLYMIPGKEKSLNTWFKDTLQTFFEVFVRIGVLFFCIYLIAEVDRSIDNILGFNQVSGFMVRNICRIFVIIGILLFAKQAPQLICDILGIKNEGALLSLRKRLNDTKDAIKGVAAPVAGAVNRIGGAVGGVVAARKAYREGLKAGNKDSRLKSGLASFHGLRNGFNGGLRNIGAAYNYEMETQRSYALDKNEDTFTQVKNASKDMLRDNFGFQTRYEDYKRQVQIKRDNELSSHREYVTAAENAMNEKRQKIDEKFDASINDNGEAFNAANEYKTAVRDETLKEDNKVYTTNEERLSYLEKNGNAEEQAYARTARAVFTRDGQLNDSSNNYGLEQLLKDITRKNEDGSYYYTNEEQIALTNYYKSSQDYNDTEYLKKWDDVTSTIKLKHNNLTLASQKGEAGVITRYNEKTGQFEKNDDLKTQIQDFLKDPAKMLKLKKEFGIKTDEAKLAKDVRMKNEPIEFEIHGETIKSNMYDIDINVKREKEKMEKINKDTERILEAYKDQEQLYELKKQRNNAAPKYKSKGNGN